MASFTIEMAHRPKHQSPQDIVLDMQRVLASFPLAPKMHSIGVTAQELADLRARYAHPGQEGDSHSSLLLGVKLVLKD